MAEPRPDMFICKIEYETTKDSTTYTTLIELGNKSLLYVTYLLHNWYAYKVTKVYIDFQSLRDP